MIEVLQQMGLLVLVILACLAAFGLFVLLLAVMSWYLAEDPSGADKLLERSRRINNKFGKWTSFSVWFVVLVGLLFGSALLLNLISSFTSRQIAGTSIALAILFGVIALPLTTRKTQ
jgi:hypothetical protein